MFSQPPGWAHIPLSERQQLRFRWDDTRASKDFLADPDPFLELTQGLSLRARLVLCVGMYEWVMWRFDRLHTHQEAKQICEAAWCATVDPRYMNFFELSRPDWQGPVLGPLWCAATWLRPALVEGDVNSAEVEDALQYLYRLGTHVAPQPEVFQSWLYAVASKMSQHFHRVEEDPFVDLFDRGIGQRRGRLISRDVLDPKAQASDDGARAFVAALFLQANPEVNAFLALPEDMLHAGMTAVPYKL